MARIRETRDGTVDGLTRDLSRMAVTILRLKRGNKTNCSSSDDSWDLVTRALRVRILHSYHKIRMASLGNAEAIRSNKAILWSRYHYVIARNQTQGDPCNAAQLAPQ